MELILERISDFMVDGITEIITDNDCLFGYALAIFAICFLGEIIFAFLSKKDIVPSDKGIFLGFLIFNVTISLSAVMICKLWFAVIISAVAVLVLPIVERKELNNYLKTEHKLSVKKYLIYIASSIISVFAGIVIIRVLNDQVTIL